MTTIDPLKRMHSVEAEQAVLGAIMLDCRCFPSVAAKVTKEAFYRHDHRLIFEACESMHAQGIHIDVVTVTQSLQAAGTLSEAGGLVYIGELARNTPSVIGAEGYARIVDERHSRRKLFAAGMMAENLAKSDDPLPECIGKVRTTIDQIGNISDKGTKSVATYMGEWTDEIRARHERGDRLQGIPTGFQLLDDRWYGLCSPDLIIIAGRPSMGKTTLGLNIAEAACANGASVLFFSLEMSARQLADKRVSALTGIPLDTIRRASFTADQWGLITDASDKISKRKMMVNETSGISIDAAAIICGSHQSRHGLDLVVFDYLGLMTKPGAENRLQEVKAISAGLKGIAKDLKIPVIALAQLNRKCEDRINKRPTMADLRESGDIEQDADIVSFVYRHEKYDPDNEQWKGVAEIITDKHRNGECGTDMVRSELRQSRFLNPDYPIVIRENKRKKNETDL